jgi:hypothetical protein
VKRTKALDWQGRQSKKLKFLKRRGEKPDKGFSPRLFCFQKDPRARRVIVRRIRFGGGEVCEFDCIVVEKMEM